VNVICPGTISGIVMTEAARGVIVSPDSLRLIPNSLSDAAEAAKLVALLSSEHAAYITGDVIRVDGGWYIPHPDTAA
jgi:NAD(P)-dependent dehydrogenase (short-subunit alcohol dehydrogenase family)